MLLALCLVTACGGAQQPNPTVGGGDLIDTTLEQAQEAAESAQLAAAVTDATRTARSAVRDALFTVGASDSDVERTLFVHLVSTHRVESAVSMLEVWQPDPDDRDAYIAVVTLAIEAGDLEYARTIAWACAETFADRRAEFVELWYDSFMYDEVFLPPDVLTIVPGEHIDEIQRLGGGSTVTLKFRLNGETVAAFKPMQTREQSNYRAEIAAYRLCALIHCEFDVPYNREVRIREEDFLELYGLSSLEATSGYSNNFSDLIWFEDADGVHWLHGTMKEWVPGFTTFPLEHHGGWRALLSVRTPRETIENLTFYEAIQGMRGQYRNNHRGMMDRAAGTSGFEFVHQLSNLHVFDFLLNNWDRYSDAFFGVNCQFDNGRFLSIDNGATMQLSRWGAPTRTFRRLQRVQLFSRRTVNAIRWMDLERVSQFLFPPSPWHDDEVDRFEGFENRRASFLEYVDGLIEEYGEDQILVFP